MRILAVAVLLLTSAVASATEPYHTENIMNKEIAGYVKNHNSGKRRPELVQLVVSECRDIATPRHGAA